MYERFHTHCAHRGVRSTALQAADLYYCPGFEDFCKTENQKCEICCTVYSMIPEKVKSSTHVIESKHVFERVVIDFTELPEVDAATGCKYLLVGVDHFSAKAFIKPCVSETAKEAIEWMWTTFGVNQVKIFHFDNGSHFTARVMERFVESIGAKKVHGSPYHPQSQGKTEQMNRNLKKLIARILAETKESQSNWVNAAYTAVNIHNNLNRPSYGKNSAPNLICDGAVNPVFLEMSEGDYEAVKEAQAEQIKNATAVLDEIREQHAAKIAKKVQQSRVKNAKIGSVFNVGATVAVRSRSNKTQKKTLQRGVGKAIVLRVMTGVKKLKVQWTAKGPDGEQSGSESTVFMSNCKILQQAEDANYSNKTTGDSFEDADEQLEDQKSDSEIANLAESDSEDDVKSFVGLPLSNNAENDYAIAAPNDLVEILDNTHFLRKRLFHEQKPRDIAVKKDLLYASYRMEQEEKQKKLVECDRCEKSFVGVKGLSMHQRTCGGKVINEKKKARSKLQSKRKLSDKSDIDDSTMTIFKTKSKTCAGCGVGFAGDAGLQQHLRCSNYCNKKRKI